MDIKAEVRRAAVLIGKAENMRVSASKVVCDLRDYCKGDGRAEFVTLYGVKPTVESIYEAVQAEPEYPDAYRSLGSFRTLLAIEGSTEKDVANRQSHKAYDAGRSQSVVENSALTKAENSTNAGLVDGALDAKLRSIPFDPLAFDDVDDRATLQPETDKDARIEELECENKVLKDTLARERVEHQKELGEVELERDSLQERVEELEQKLINLQNAKGSLPRCSIDKVSTKLSSPRVERAVALFFELPAAKHLWLKQRMAEPPLQTFRTTGPHTEWVQTFWQCSKEEQDAIREQIKITEQRNAA